MADLLATSAAWLGGMFQQHAAQPVTITRGQDTCAAEATIGKTLFEIDDGSGMPVQYAARDYILPAADYAPGGTAVKPQRGDTIRESIGGETLVFEVTAPGKEPVFLYSDAKRSTIRVHTKQTKTE